MNRPIRSVTCAMLLFLLAQACAGNWASSMGSCYEKGQLSVSVGGSVWWFGPFGAVDYAFHDAISGGGAIALLFRPGGDMYLPIVARAAFHPFNLSVLASRIPVRDKIDVYVGLAMGWKFIDDPRFRIREYIGARYYFTDRFYGVLEEGSGLGNVNLGVGFEF